MDRDHASRHQPDDRLVPPHPPAPPQNEVEEVKQAATKLVGALRRLAQNKVRSAQELSQDAYQEIEHSVQIAKSQADRQLKSVTKKVDPGKNRLTQAAKAAWDVFSQDKKKG
jgi:hypothetical protein